MAEKTLRLLAIGAHPDDCDSKVGGLALLYVRAGHKVKFVSVTNGDTGHHKIGGSPLAQRRFAEAQAAAKVAGIEYDVLDIHNGQLLPTLENRWRIVEIIRRFRPDIVITHRPNDYHPDHRYTGEIVQDAAYTVTIPNVAALTPHLRRNPVFAHMSDRFQKPCPFKADVVVSIDSVFRKKMRMLDCHKSQFYEWLPYNAGKAAPPGDRRKRFQWLVDWRAPAFAKIADRHRDLLKRLYGEKKGARVRYAEAFEISEYGAQVDEKKLRTLFPFFGS